MKKGDNKSFIPFISMLIFIIILIIVAKIHANAYYIKVGNVGINESEYKFFYNLTINKFKSDYSDYLNYMDIDFNKDLSTQYMEDDVSWEDYFETQTDMMVYGILAVVNDAKENNYEYDLSDEVNEMISYLAEDAAAQNLSFDKYIKYTYDANITEKMIEKCMEYYLLSNKYIDEKCNTELTDEDYENYYKSNKDSLDAVEFYVITLSSDDEDKLKEEMNNIHNLDEFKEKAIELQQDEGYNKITGLSNCNSLYSNWLFNADNDTMNVFSDSENSFLIYKVNRYKDESLTKNIYKISVEIEDESLDSQYLDTILNLEEDFNNSSKTSEDLIDIAKQYSLNAEKETNIVYSEISPLIGNWLFEDREMGDTTIIKTSDEYNFIYFNGDGIETYKVLSNEKILENKSKNFLDDLKEKYKFEKK